MRDFATVTLNRLVPRMVAFTDAQKLRIKEAMISYRARAAEAKLAGTLDAQIEAARAWKKVEAAMNESITYETV